MTTLIYYLPGAYGTFIEWLLTYLTDLTLGDDLPFNPSGNAHKSIGNLLLPNINFDSQIKMITSKNKKFVRTHPNIVTKFGIDIFEYFDQVIEITFDKNSIFWMHGNMQTKVHYDHFGQVEKYYTNKYTSPETLEFLQATNEEERFRLVLKNDNQTHQSKNFGYNNIDSVEDLSKWQLREILSYWNFDMYLAEYINYTPLRGNVHHLNVTELRDNFKETIDKVIEYLKLDVIKDRYQKLEKIGYQWSIRQKEKFKDQQIANYISDTIQAINQEHTNFSFFEEAWIQQKLREQGYEIKCNGLDNFPTSSFEMHKLIYDKKQKIN